MVTPLNGSLQVDVCFFRVRCEDSSNKSGIWKVYDSNMLRFSWFNVYHVGLASPVVALTKVTGIH